MNSTIVSPVKEKTVLSLLHPAVVEQSAAKVGIYGRQGSGKSTTALLLAIGLSKTYHGGAPIAMQDTESGSDFLVSICKMEGVELLVLKSRAFSDLVPVAKEAQQYGCCVEQIDSYTHPWWELNNSLKQRLGVKKLLFHHQDELKSLWREWTDFMLNSPLHMLLCGRLGYEWDREENEDGSKSQGELIKLGTKMKSEGEAGYEPALLIEMEGIQDSELRMRKSRTKRGSITHHAYVLKDKWRALNGRTFSWPDLNEYKVGDWEKVFDRFLPHFSKLAIGHQQRAVNAARTSVGLFDPSGNSAYQKRARQVQITLEEIEGTLVTLWAGQDAKSKELKRVAVEVLFGTRSWTAVESKSLEELEIGLKALKMFEGAVQREDGNAVINKENLIHLLRLSQEQARIPSPEPARLEEEEAAEEEFLSPREALLLVSTAKRLGWQESEFVSALVEKFGIGGPDFIPVAKYEDVLAMIEGEKQVILEGMQCH